MKKSRKDWGIKMTELERRVGGAEKLKSLSNGDIFGESESTRQDYDNQFGILVGNVKSACCLYTFHYKERPKTIKVFGSRTASYFTYKVSYDEADLFSVRCGKIALEIALDYLGKKYSKKIRVNPKEYKIGIYTAWKIKK